MKRRQLLQALALPLFLIGREPDLAQFFALGQKVIVVFKGKIYQTT